jgi:PAS domain S-box-containing protein
MESEWKWDKLDFTERQVVELLLQGKSNAAICSQVFLSRARVQECIKRIPIKTGADSTRAAIVLLVEERETRTLLRVLDQATDGVGIVQDRVAKFANRALLEISGYDLEEMVGTPLMELIAPRARDLVLQRYDQRMNGIPFPQSYKFSILCKDGQEKDALLSYVGVIQYRGRPALLATIVPAA